MGIDVLLTLQEHFLIVSHWEENVCGGVRTAGKKMFAGEFVAKQMLVFFSPRAGRANRFVAGMWSPIDW